MPARTIRKTPRESLNLTRCRCASRRTSGSASNGLSCGRLALRDAGTKRRASLHLVRGDAALLSFDLGGQDAQAADLDAFALRLTLENHTLKRALTDPRIFSGIGNAYSDEILHRA